MNFFLYRKPGDTAIHSGYSDKLSEGIHIGFVFAPFGESAPIYTIPSEFEEIPDKSSLIKWGKENENVFRESNGFPISSTGRHAHGVMVTDAIHTLHKIKDTTGISGKIIVSRIKIVTANSQPIDIFHRLCKLYPDTFAFLFSTPVSGTWMGASPELLLDYDGNEIKTISLAGTRPAGVNDAWDDKNSEEQQIVTDFITYTLRQSGFLISQSLPYTRNAGNIEHIATDITGIAPDGPTSIENLLKALAPTPALSGFPRKEAIDFISYIEPYPRHYYGGFAGVMTTDNKIRTFVNLRSGRYDHTLGIALYAGGGITEKSIPDQEWAETKNKLNTFESAL